MGDIALYGRYSVTESDVYAYFREVALELREFDYVVGNLETPFCDVRTAPFGHKSAHIRSDPANVKLLTYLNVNAVNLANNHIYDYGREGFLRTVETLDKNNIKYFGVDNKELLLVHGSANKIAFSGYCCYSTNALGYGAQLSRLGVNPLVPLNVEASLLRNSEHGFLNICSMHHGQEHVNMPNYDHVLLARKLASRVSQYVFYGHHPHVLQGLESYKGSLLAYSLGNFCLDDVYTPKSRSPLVRQTAENKKSIILALTVEQGRLVRYEIIPVYAAGDKLVVREESIRDDIDRYSKYLDLDEKTYRQCRNRVLKGFLSSRKKRRDVKWYLKRLNHKSAMMIINSRRNSKSYRSCVRAYINTN